MFPCSCVPLPGGEALGVSVWGMSPLGTGSSPPGLASCWQGTSAIARTLLPEPVSCSRALPGAAARRCVQGGLAGTVGRLDRL